MTAEVVRAQEKGPGAFPPFPAEAREASDAFGLGPQDHWVAATEFNAAGPNLSGGFAPALVWDSGANFFPYFRYDITSSAVLYAHLRLPAGARVTSMQCFFRGTVAGVPSDVLLIKAWHDLTLNAPGFSVLGNTPWQSSGYGQPSVALNETVRYLEANRRNMYLLELRLHSDLGPGFFVSFAGCNFTWNRQVTPAPGSATFTDVPLGHQQFRFVEALVAAGITAGCGGGNYCPGEAITRGQMAVFLAAALGLHFPN